MPSRIDIFFWLKAVFFISISIIFAAINLAQEALVQALLIPPAWIEYTHKGIVALSVVSAFILIWRYIALPLKRNEATLEALLESKRYAAVREHERNQSLQEMDAQLSALAQKFADSDDSLKERQQAISQMHVQIAERALGAADALLAATAQQKEKSDLFQAQLDTVYSMVQGVEGEVSRLKSIDLDSVAETNKQLRRAADTIEHVTSNLESCLERLSTASDHIGQTGTDLESQSQSFADSLNAALDRVDASQSRLDSVGDKLTAAQDGLAEFIQNGKGAVTLGLKAVIGTSKTLSKATNQLERQAQAHIAKTTSNQASLENNMAAIREQAEQCLAGLEKDVHSASQSIEAQARAVAERCSTLDGAFEAASAYVQKLSDAVDAISLKRDQTVDNSSSEVLTAIDDALAKFEMAQTQFLTENKTLLGEAVIASSTAIRDMQAALPLNDFHSKLDGIAKACDGLVTALADAIPAKALEESLVGEVRTIRDALTNLAKVTQTQSGLLEETRSAAARSSAQLDTVGEAVLSAAAKMSGDVTTLQGQLADIVDQPGIGEVIALIETTAHNIDNRFEKQRAAIDEDKQALASQISKVMRTQMRGLSADLADQYKKMNETLKHLKSNQIQSLKTALRKVPASVVEDIAPALSSHTKAVEDQISDLITQFKEASQAAVVEQAAAEDHAADTPAPDAAMLDLSERLTRALETMNGIEEEVTALTVAALAAPDCAAQNEDFRAAIVNADAALSSWSDKLGNITTALAMARDAA